MDLKSTRRLVPIILGLGISLWSSTQSRATDPIDFSRDVRPILSDNCFLCHGPDGNSRKANLRLDLRDEALRKKDPVIVPGKSSESTLMDRITSHEPDEVMPPKKTNKKLTATQIEVLKRWIDEGAKWGGHWSWEGRKTVSPPSVSGATNPIDQFIRSRLAAEQLLPSPEADKTTLVRRVTLDLTGLPPSIEEVDKFLADRSSDAYERLVDRLLGSPRYGERMAWDWLEAARYADSNGYQGDSDRTMWPWRDWVISALNRNQRFDEFTIWQLAGDLLPGSNDEQKLATGFNRNHMINGEGGRIAEENRVDYVMDMTETTATVWMGLTFNCCRCHDHKYDALTQRDYYRLFAFFNQTPVDGGGGNPQTPPNLAVPSIEQKARAEELKNGVTAATKTVDEIEKALFPRPNGQPPANSGKASVLKTEIVTLLKNLPADRSRAQVEQLANLWKDADPIYAKGLNDLKAAIDSRDNHIKSYPRVMVMADLPKPRDSFLLTRGSYERPTEKVSADVPGSLPGISGTIVKNRLALARWLVSPSNPLTARVVVNRVWQQFFGTGLVKTPEDFGSQGERPTHPELLDWLASNYVESGWDTKALHRLIVTSATYRQSSRVNKTLLERDPMNRLLARGTRFRLPSWMIRDQALSASGLLVERLGGSSVKPYQPEGVWEEATFGTRRYERDKGEALYRRSLYTFWRRIVGPTEFFDVAARQTCVVKPVRTNTPLHALITLNDVTFVEASRALAQRVIKTGGKSSSERIDLAFRLLLARHPSADEMKVLETSFDRCRKEFASDPTAADRLLKVGESARDKSIDPLDHAAMTSVCAAILNLDETLSKE